VEITRILNNAIQIVCAIKRKTPVKKTGFLWIWFNPGKSTGRHPTPAVQKRHKAFNFRLFPCGYSIDFPVYEIVVIIKNRPRKKQISRKDLRETFP
jgi:hypothetical protein